MSKEVKHIILSHSRNLLEKKLLRFQNELKQLQNSSNEETKSSMGDKYETGRAMLMQEQEKMADQIELINGQLRLLQSLNLDKGYKDIQFGSLVKTQQGLFFISISLGLIQEGDLKAFMVSANAPVAQAMLGKKRGESFILNGKSIKILAVS